MLIALFTEFLQKSGQLILFHLLKKNIEYKKKKFQAHSLVETSAIMKNRTTIVPAFMELSL